MKEHFVVPDNLNKRLISTLMSNRSPDSNENKNFTLKCTSEFASRSGDIFAGLQTLEKNHETWISKNKVIEFQEEAEDQAHSSKRTKLENVTRKPESIIVRPHGSTDLSSDVVFKKPFPSKPPKRNLRSIQNFKRKTQKWTKYSLEDVPLSSDSKNTAVALQFIDELRKRRESMTETVDSSEKIIFNRPISKKPKNKANKEKVVAEEKDKVSSSTVKLLHLDDEDSD